MNPFMIWFADNLGAILIVGLLLATLSLVASGRAAWRLAKRVHPPERPWLRLALSLLLALTSGAIILLLGSGLIEMGPGMWAQRAMLGEPAPELAFALVESDRPGRLTDYAGQVVLVNMWATWCPPCIKEMPDLDRLQSTYFERGLVVLHVSDEDRETLLAWLGDRQAETVHAYAQPIPWPETGRPTTYILDREGIVRRVLLGQRSFEQFEHEVQRHL